jgi:hypothetical protein
MDNTDKQSLGAKKAKADEVLENLVNVHYAKANCWGRWLLSMQVLLYGSGVVAIFVPAVTLSYPPLAILLAVTSTWFAIQISKFKGTAETLKRHHEYWQGFGKDLPSGLLADLRVTVSGGVTDEEDRLLRQGIRFASAKPLGPARVLENLCESAWFTKHHATWCAEKLGVVFVLTVVLAILVLLVFLSSIKTLTSMMVAAQCVSVTLSTLLSIGVFRSWLEFRGYSQKAGDIEAESQRLLKFKTVDAFEAQRILAEYQLVRAGAPTIPTWVWKIQRERLNRSWDDLKKPTD